MSLSNKTHNFANMASVVQELPTTKRIKKFRYPNLNESPVKITKSSNNKRVNPVNLKNGLTGNKALVVDAGAYTIKIGLSSEPKPDLIPNCIMKAKSERKRLFIGNQISECRDCSGLFYLLPCERGYITKWDVQKPVWDFVFGKSGYPIKEYPLIMSQPLFNFKSVQDCTDEIFFDEYEVRSMCRLNPTDFAMIKYNADHNLPHDHPCLIVDSGFSFTHIIPYFEGKKYTHGIRRLNVGGKLLTNHLKDIISYRQYNVMEETYVINQVKEDTCYVADDVREELKMCSKNSKTNNIVKNYVLPDFNYIRRGYVQNCERDERAENCQILRLNNEQFIVPEILFHPSDIGMKSMGIAEAIVKSIMLCPVEYQQILATNIVLIGGNFKFPGIKERLYKELRSTLPNMWDLNVYKPDDPITYSWAGGGKLFKRPDFKSILVTKEDYEEFGSHFAQQKFNNWMSINELRKEKDVQIDEKPSVDLIGNIKKSKNLFGKSIPDSLVPINSNPSTAKSSPANSVVNGEVPSKSASPPENNTPSTSIMDESTDMAMDDSSLSMPESVELVKKKPTKILNSSKAKPKDDDLLLCSDEEVELEEDLTTSNDLFPLGFGSYL